MKPYLYFDGLLKLAKDAKGTEVVHTGIRPYGFHAGNVMALIVYPYLLCKYLEKEGKEARFKFVVSINDWEQDALDGPDYRKYPFNIFPKHTILRYVSDKRGCCPSVVEHWGPIIERNVRMIKTEYPKVSFRFIKNSELISKQICKELLLETLANPKTQLNLLKKYSGKKVLDIPTCYAGAICPKCHGAHGITKITGKSNIDWKCNDCGYLTTQEFKKFQYWWYHKPMLLARIKIFKVDITISGGDHFSEGDFEVRRAFINKFSPTTKEPKMLFTPTVISLDGQRMSKSKHNTYFADVSKLIKTAEGFRGSEILIPKDLILYNVDEKNYSYIL